jgi:hypothetical protein
MFHNQFVALDQQLLAEGRKNPSASVAASIRRLYLERYARPGTTSLDIAVGLAEEFPEQNVTVALRPVIDYSRE